MPPVLIRPEISRGFRVGLSGGCFAIQLAAVRWAGFGALLDPLGPSRAAYGAELRLYPRYSEVLLIFFPVFSMGDFWNDRGSALMLSYKEPDMLPT